MILFSFSNIFNIEMSGITVFIGIAFFFFVNRKSPYEESGLDLKSISVTLKDKKILILLFLPLIMDAVSIFLSKLLLPEYIPHVLSRVDSILTFDKFVILLIQLIVLALGEEIAWRGFFQQQIQKSFPIIPTIIFSSILFALGHIANGNTFVVIYDISFVAINSFIYGYIFYKMKNIYVSALSHFIANLFSMIVILLFI